MLAAALAKELGSCCFLSVQAASLFQKYMGESEKMAKAVFSLARKLAPCVVFLDEIDLLMQQDGGLNAANNKVLGTLLADWDGLDASGSEAKVVVVATSNNPKNLPASIHRRLPRQYYLGPPDQAQRARILQSILAGEGVDAELVASVAAATGRYCGSDLMELCKAAMSNRLRHGEGAPFEWAHFEAAMQCVRFAGSSAEEQLRSEVREWLHDNTTGDGE
jgi:SpoVK/Ycf46/Vps4 family AAA+-type ATPase